MLAVSHENPDADTLGATLGVVRIVEALGGTADAVCTDPVPALYDFISGVERFRTDPDTSAPYDLLVISDCGSLERIGEVGVRHADLFARLPRVIIDHHASNDAAETADWIDPAGRRDVRDGHPAGQPPRRSRSTPAMARWRPP